MAAAVRGVSNPGPEPIKDSHPTRHLLAQRLRLLRTLRGWSQETLAEQAGLHRTYISGIERAERNLGLDNLDKLAQAFGVTVVDLLTANPMTEPHVGTQNKTR
jgi:transcriptional regulator with XRE-family HTH domain